MPTCSMDAEYKGEERYSKLSLAYGTEEERQLIEKAISDITTQYDLTPQIYVSDIANGRKVLVIEYHDDYDRTAGAIFEKMMKQLGIKECS